MPRLSELWDVNKYSEGDPIRQLIAASQTYRDWPSDALAWGADLVDMGTGALSKLSSGERRNQIKTDLGGNLRRALATPRSELGMSEGPAPDVEAGRSVGRMLNPALLMQGDIPGSRALANFQLRKRLADAIPVNKARRAFFAGKEEAMAKPSNEAIVDALSPIAEVGNEIANAPVDRRDFLKGSAALGGAAAVGGGLLSKFGKVGEAIERAPEATRVAKAAEEVSKYKYNSLKEYLDDVVKSSTQTEEQFVNELIQRERNRPYRNEFPLTENDIKNLEENARSAYYHPEVEDFHTENIRNRLLDDEVRYKDAKKMFDEGIMYRPDGTVYSRSRPNLTDDMIHDEVKHLEAFSPQAKQEMALYKGKVNAENFRRRDPLGINGYQEPLHWTDIEALRLLDDTPYPF